MGGIFGAGSSGNSQGTSGYQLPGMNPFQRDRYAGDVATYMKDFQAGLEKDATGFRQNLGNYAGQASGSGQQLGQNFGSANLNTNFQAPQFGTGLDARGQQLMSQELGNRRAQLDAGQNQIASQFKNNPKLAAILGMQNSAQGKLNNNPLAFQAAEARNGQMINEANATNNAQQLSNNANLQQTGSQNDALSQGNNAKLQQQQSLLQGLQSAAGFGQMRGAAGQQGLSQLSQLLDVYAPKAEAQQQKSSSGGLLSGILK